MKHTPLVVGNWKQNPMTQADALSLAKAVAKAEKKTESTLVAVAPPHIYLSIVQKALQKSPIVLGAQTVSVHDGGAHTGEISARQLKDLGVSYVIVGHSEQRAAGVTNTDVEGKIDKIFKAGCTPIVCVGEQTRDEHGDFFSFIEGQLRSLARGLTAAQLKKLVIAYEPIWAIGTGKTATAADVKEMQLFIESVLTKLYDRKTAQAICLLYGGSVKPH
ncbi:triose-phosphate isomerase, partial [Candidatus Kaiserbacteria bacterium]|nr:triose-phosphate isomerase [Candidatus Kaiserbacteria bacterium]